MTAIKRVTIRLLNRLQSRGARRALFVAGLMGAAALILAPEFLPVLSSYRYYALAAAVLWTIGLAALILLSVVNTRVSRVSRDLQADQRDAFNALKRRIEDVAETQRADSRSIEVMSNSIEATNRSIPTIQSNLDAAVETLRKDQLSSTRTLEQKLSLDISASTEIQQGLFERLQAEQTHHQQSQQDLYQHVKTELVRFQEMMSVGRVADVEHIAVTGSLLAALALNQNSSSDSAGFIPRSQHGHALLIRELFRDCATDRMLSPQAGYHVLEIGTTREKWWPQMSTSRLAAVCRALSLRMLTVDVDPAGARSVREIADMYPKVIDAKTEFGEKLLSDWEGSLPPYIYIDAYDFDHPDHSEERQERYRTLQGDTISNEACWEMHLACAHEFVTKCDIGGKVVFDDAFFNDNEWSGKGKTAVPFMLANGFELEAVSETAALLVKRDAS